MAGLRIVDVTELSAFQRLPPCIDGRFDHRTCDYWEDADRGSNRARPGWLEASPTPSPTGRPPADHGDNPFAPSSDGAATARQALAAAFLEDERDSPMTTGPALGSMLDPLGGDDLFATPGWNPFAPAPQRRPGPAADAPRKLRLLTRGLAVFGSYARVALDGDDPVAYAQFGPLSAYPRAQRLRELYPILPASPLPAVITCISATAAGRRAGAARRLVEDVCDELGRRGFAAVEAYPDLTRPTTETSAGTLAFWQGCGFELVVADERFPVVRQELV